MERRDYLAKEIEKLALLLGKLLGLKEISKPDAFKTEAEQGYLEFFGLDFSNPDPALFREKILAVADVDRLEYLAEMLETDLHFVPHDTEARRLRKEVLDTVLSEMDRLYAERGTFSFTNRLRRQDNESK